MNVARVFLVLLLIATAMKVPAQTAGSGTATLSATQKAEQALTVASVVDRQITLVEKQVTDAAEAMPEEKYNFSPETLTISGSDYKGVRSFAQQVKHIAASNYAIWWRITGENFPKDYMGGNGPENIKTKAEILKFLKDSFDLGHRAAATLTQDNMLQPPMGSSNPRLYLTTFAVEHAFDHYGQMVEYLRMNGIVPPASQPKKQ